MIPTNNQLSTTHLLSAGGALVTVLGNVMTFFPVTAPIIISVTGLTLCLAGIVVAFTPKGSKANEIATEVQQLTSGFVSTPPVEDNSAQSEAPKTN